MGNFLDILQCFWLGGFGESAIGINFLGMIEGVFFTDSRNCRRERKDDRLPVIESDFFLIPAAGDCILE